MRIYKRNVALDLVFSFLTCGLYTLYLINEVDKEVNFLTGLELNSPSSDVLFTVITCGLYGIYWYYKVGRQVENLIYNVGLRPMSISILNLVLALFGFGIISMAITQSEINHVIDETYLY